MNKILYIVRGLPGSGKSTFAKTLTEYHWEADMFFMNENDKYVFDSSKIKEAHQWCRDNVEKDMILGIEKIAVSNTFTQEWEIQSYLDLAKKYGYTVISLIVENRHKGINTHGVPDETLEKMRNRFEIKL